LQERLRSCEPALGLIRNSQIIQGQGEVWVVRAQDLLLDGQCSFVKIFGLLALSLPVLDGGQIVQADRHFVMFAAVSALEDHQRAPVERLSFVVLALRVEKRRQGGQIGSNLHMVLSQGTLTDFNRPPRKRLAARKPASLMLQSAEVMVNGCELLVPCPVCGLENSLRSAIGTSRFRKPVLVFQQHSQ